MPAAQVGEPAVASWLPSTAYYTLQNSLTTAPPGDPGKPGIERSPGGMTVRIFGRTPLGQHGLHAALAIEDPADYAARALRAMLLARGVQVSGTARAQHRLSTETGDFLSAQQQPVVFHPLSIENVQSANAGQFLLASHVSPPLGDDLVVTNKVSQNLHAEITLRTLGKLESSDGSLLEGTRVVRQFLISAGVAPGDFVLFDGCGLSPQDLVTPRSLYDFARLRGPAELGRRIPHFSARGGSGWLPFRPLQTAVARWQSVRQDRYSRRSTCLERVPGCRQWADGRFFHYVYGSHSIPAGGSRGDGQYRGCDCGVELKTDVVGGFFLTS